jgi:hypothetical protein
MRIKNMFCREKAYDCQSQETIALRKAKGGKRIGRFALAVLRLEPPYDQIDIWLRRTSFFEPE